MHTPSQMLARHTPTEIAPHSQRCALDDYLVRPNVNSSASEKFYWVLQACTTNDASAEFQGAEVETLRRNRSRVGNVGRKTRLPSNADMP